LTKTYEVPPFPNNDFAMSIYTKLYGKGKSYEKSPLVACPPMQSENFVTKKIGVAIQHAEARTSSQIICGIYAQTIETALTSDSKPLIKNKQTILSEVAKHSDIQARYKESATF
jgi:hypothetical protein